ncbi:hypothetical protein PIB30_036602 [Stylosanthes scabra]|uniref:Uncharacterized protein n=1 Tax=Stylosanthes scabra TaxID=79078 RepID=A0ABU6QE08_9FABA|nr:hypothetical protein [Stylosanthes scabra]
MGCLGDVKLFAHEKPYLRFISSSRRMREVRRGRPRTVRPFAPDHFVPAVPPPRPTPPGPLPPPTSSPSSADPTPIIDISDDDPSESSHGRSTEASESRKISESLPQGQSFASEQSMGGSTSASSSRRTFDDPMDRCDSFDSADYADDLLDH